MSENDVQQKKSTFEFTGTGKEYFKIWIVNILLSLITLGIYSAWAKIRSKRYFYGNTLLNDSPFEYHATPKQILIGRMIALVLLVIYLVTNNLYPSVAGVLFLILIIVTPWIIYRSIRFNARMSSYRNVRFNFKGSALPFYKYLYLYAILPALVIAVIAVFLNFLGMPKPVITTLSVLAVFSFYGAFPWVKRNVTEYVMNQYTYGQGQFKTSPQLSTRRYYFIYSVAIILFFLILILISGLAYVAGVLDLSLFTQFDRSESVDPQVAAEFSSFLILLYVPLIIAGLLFKAYTQAGIRNHVFSHTKLDNVVSLFSSVTTGRLFVLFLGNFLLIIFTLGLAYPWVAVRIAHYFARNSQVHTSGDFTHYISQQQEKQSALGEELGDIFDVDMDLGM